MLTVDNLGTDIYFEVVGSGPPLVLQHGRLGSGRFWEAFGYTDALSDDRTLVIIDARGHGNSAKPRDPEAYGPEEMASDVIAVLDAMDIDETDFLGYSMGGRIGFAALAHHPDRFNSLIAGGSGPHGPAISAAAELALADTLANGIATYVDGMEKMLDRTISDSDRAVLLANDAEALTALARRTATWPNVVEQVAAVDVPIQLFGGSADPIWPMIEQAHQRLPRSALHCFGPLGHGEELRQPALVLPLVRTFLERHGLTG